MRAFFETLGGMGELLRLAYRSGFRLKGSWWTWRYETAFGNDAQARPPFFERIRALLDYGRWVYRLRRGR